MVRGTAAVLALVSMAVVVLAAPTTAAASKKAKQQSLRMDPRSSTTTIDTLRKDAENQKAIMASKGKKKASKGPSQPVKAQSMTPHLEMHATRGVESARGRREEKQRKQRYQISQYGKQVLPPDEATPFFTTYVLHWAFPTIAVICTCLGCILLRTMKMYQKERWKGTSYFHGNGRIVFCVRVRVLTLLYLCFCAEQSMLRVESVHATSKQGCCLYRALASSLEKSIPPIWRGCVNGRVCVHVRALALKSLLLSRCSTVGRVPAAWPEIEE